MIVEEVVSFNKDIFCYIGKHINYLCDLSCGHSKYLRSDQIKKLVTICECCSTKEIKNSAINSSCTHIPLDLHPKNRAELYTLGCGHSTFKLRQSIKLGQFKCDICFTNEIKNRCEDAGVSFISKKGDVVTVKLPCGHNRDIKHNRIVHQNSIPCPTCLKNLHKERGLEAVPDKPDHYNFLSCGHEQRIASKEVRLDMFWCRTCRINKFKQEAEEAGLDYVGLASKKASRIYKLPCGCHKEIEISRVREGSFVCHEHELTYYTLPSKVYLFCVDVGDEKILKLGFSANPEIRCRGYGLLGEFKISLLCEKHFETGGEACRFEKDLHSYFKDKRYPPNKAKKYFTNSGYTECYPYSLLEALLHKLENI